MASSLQIAKQEFDIVGDCRSLYSMDYLGLELTCYSDKAWFNLSGYVNSQSSIY
jgi:hypothetical protein